MTSTRVLALAGLVACLLSMLGFVAGAIGHPLGLWLNVVATLVMLLGNVRAAWWPR
jgi:hypothetical protein